MSILPCSPNHLPCRRAAYLVDLGIERPHIFMETKARYTIENAFLVRSLIADEGRLAFVTSVVVVTNQFHGDRTRVIFREAFERVEPHQRRIDTRMVAAQNGDPDVLAAETGKGLVEWCSAEEAQLEIDVHGTRAGAHGGSLLMHRTRAHFDLLHAIRTQNAVAYWQTQPKNVLQVTPVQPPAYASSLPRKHAT